MSLELLNQISDWSGLFTALVFPVLLFVVLKRRLGGDWDGLLFFIVVLVGWGALVAHRALTLPYKMAYISATHPQFSDPASEMYHQYDGVGGNIVVIWFGWLPPLGALIVFLIIRWCWRLWRGGVTRTRPSGGP